MKIIRIIKDIIKLHKVGLPNTGPRKQYIIDALNLYYALKNIHNDEQILEQSNKLNMTEMWSKYNLYIEFQQRYYSKKDYLYGPAIRAVTGGFHKRNKNKTKYNIRNDEQKDILKKICLKLEKTFSTISFNQWYDNLSISFSFLDYFKKNQIELYSKIKNITVVEFGPGTGIHSLLYQSISNQTCALYDLPQMQSIQRFLHKEYLQNDTKKLEKFDYFSDLRDLEKFLDGRKFCFISNWAFSETSISLRLDFEKLLNQSEFALFISNKFMSGVDNEKYFHDLSKRMRYHDYFYTNLHNIDNLPNFMKKHKAHLFYKTK